MVVDLPAPLGPMNATDCPTGTSRVIPSTAVTLVTRRRNPCQRTSANVFLNSQISTPRFILSLRSNEISAESLLRSGQLESVVLRGFDSGAGDRSRILRGAVRAVRLP